MGGAERVERQHATGRLTVRERIDRLFDAGTLPRDRRARRRGDLRRRRRARRLPARQRRHRPGPDRRAPGGRPGRRLHRPRRRRRRRHLAEDGLRRAHGARPAPAARAARRRHRRRRQRQVAREDGLHLRAAAPGLRRWWSQTSRRVPVVAAALGPSPGSAPRASSPRTSRVIVRGTAQLFVAGPPVVAAAMGESPDKEELGGARAQTARRRGRQRGRRRGGRARAAPALPLLPAGAASWEPPPVVAAHRPAPTAARRSCCRSSRATRASPTRCARILELVLDRGSLFELGARYGALADHRAGPARRAAGRRARLRPQALRRRPDRRRLGQARPLRRPAATSSACRSSTSSTSPGFVIGTEAERAGHDPPRRARAVRRLPGDRAVGARSSCARSTASPAPAHGDGVAAEPALRLAVGRLGLAADRRRPRGRLPARARGGRGPGRAARRDRGAPRTPCARRSAPPSASASRRSSTRATPARCCATGPRARTSWSATSSPPARRRAGSGPRRRDRLRRVPERTIVFFPEGAFGPTNNCVGIGDVLRERGHRVVFVIEESFAGTLEAQGFEERLMRLGPPPEQPEEPGQFWKDFIRDTAPVFRKSTFEQLDEFIAPTWRGAARRRALRRRPPGRDLWRGRARRHRRGQRLRLPRPPGERPPLGANRLLQSARAEGPGAPPSLLRAAPRRPLRVGRVPRRVLARDRRHALGLRRLLPRARGAPALRGRADPPTRTGSTSTCIRASSTTRRSGAARPHLAQPRVERPWQRRAVEPCRRRSRTATAP